MYTRYATSADGLSWTLHGTALAGGTVSGTNAGARMADVLLGGPRVVAYYDGRASAEENQEEVTGIAIGDAPDSLHAIATHLRSCPRKGAGACAT